MQPLFGCTAIPPVYRFILGDKEAGKNGKRNIHASCQCSRFDRQHPDQAHDNSESIERVSDSLPAGQSPLPMKPEFVGRHAQHLKKKRECRPVLSQHLRKIAPAIVSPGPKARLTMIDPGFTEASAAAAIQMCGSVAEDMFPLSKRIVRLNRS